MLRVVITGGCGFLGQLLARAILQRDQLTVHTAEGEVERPLGEIVLADVAAPPSLLFDELEAARGSKLRVVLGSVADRAFCDRLFEGENVESISVFHLGSVMSGQGEADFDLCLNTNLHGTLHMLEAARACAAVRPRFLFASTMATIGSGEPADHIKAEDTITDACRAVSHTTYGMTKAVAELIMADYSRRHFIDGRGVRLPTIIVRAGAPNAAVTSCFSGVIREPLAGKPACMPIGGEVTHAVTGYRAAICALVRLHEVPAATADASLGDDRTVFLPSVPVTLAGLAATLSRVVAAEAQPALGPVTFEPSERLSKVVSAMPTATDGHRALALGLPPQPSVEQMIREYAEDFPDALAAGVHLTPSPPPPPLYSSCAEAARAHGDGLYVALITGGGSGIGRAVALRLSEAWRPSGVESPPEQPGGGRRGVAVVLTGRRRRPLEETSDACAALGVQTMVFAADLSRENDVGLLFDAVRARFGRIDLLFNNAGANCAAAPVEEMAAEDWSRVVGINLTGAFLAARGALRLMREQRPRGGRIINNGSVSADRPRPGSAAYTASKHGLTGLTKSIALDGREIEVACGQIDYGNVESAMTGHMSGGAKQADGTTRPEPRMLASDAADAVLYMAGLPLSANVLHMTCMATGMPLVGRG